MGGKDISSRKQAIRYLFIVVFFVANSTANQYAGPEECGGCPNPLAQLMPMQIGGDIPSNSKYIGWKEIKEGTRAATDDYSRGMEFATNFKKKNPCADIFYEMENPNPHGDPVIHVGPTGEAEYEIRSWAVIEKVSGDEKTLVKHVVYETTPLSEPRRTPGGNLQWNDVQEISNQLELVPLRGRIQISHDLVALKNGQIYDSGSEFLDWVSDPPTDEDYYFNASGKSTTINGQNYSGNLDGIILGDFASMTISGSVIVFDKGDIGITIRNKETPSRATIDIDDDSGYPPYCLIQIPEIKNQFDEPMPDGIPVALRVSQGEIEGGRELDGHKVFVTKSGGIPGPIRYRPPRCGASAKSASLELKDVCHWGGKPETVGKTRARRSIDLPACGTIKGTITYKRQIHWEGEGVAASGKLKTTHDLSEDATFFVTAKYLRTIKDGSGDVDYYEAKPLTGRYSFSMKRVNHFTGKGGGYNQVENWQDSGMVDDLLLLITVNKKTDEYTISSQIITPSKEGTSEITYANGTKLKLSAENWAINGSLDVEGRIDGTSIRGNWSKPATADTAVSNTGGMVPGATWNWSLTRVGD